MSVEGREKGTLSFHTQVFIKKIGGGIVKPIKLRNARIADTNAMGFLSPMLLNGCERNSVDIKVM